MAFLSVTVWLQQEWGRPRQRLAARQYPRRRAAFRTRDVANPTCPTSHAFSTNIHIHLKYKQFVFVEWLLL
jgi:hypothetical protein